MVSYQQGQRRVGRPHKLRIEEVKARIESWRRIARVNGKRQMPLELWQAALGLASTESPAKVIRELGLNPSNFYQRLKKQNRPSRPSQPKKRGFSRKFRSKIKFVEIAPPRPLTGNVAETRIEFVLEKAQGGKVRLLYPESQAEWLSSAIEQLLKAA